MRTPSLNRRILFIVLGLTVLSQGIYLYVNVRSFQSGYEAVVRSNLTAVGTSLKGQLDRVLGMGISIDKLVGLDVVVRDALKNAEELRAVAIRDPSGTWLYYGDRERFVGGDRAGQEPSHEVRRVLDPADAVSLPLERDGRTVGELHLQLNRDLIGDRIREIALDSATIVLISVLAVIDIVFFLIAYTISLPVRGVVRDVDAARHLGSVSLPVRRTGIDFLDGLLDRFDGFRSRVGGEWKRLAVLFEALPPPGGGVREDGTARSLLRNAVGRIRWGKEAGSVPAALASPAMIRPAVFVFIFSEALSISFLPLFAKELYRPLRDLSQEVVIGLPISAFMLSIAVALPVGGAWSETVGRRKAFVHGAILSAAGLVLTAAAQDILSLILYRSLVGLGFGVVFMASQSYVIQTTTPANRAEGLAMFISAFYAGTLCGSAIGGMLSDRIGFRPIFLLGAALALASLVFLYLFLGEEASRAAGTHRPTSRAATLRAVLPHPRDFRRLFSDRDFAALVLLQNIPNKICLIGFIYYIAPLFLQELGSSRSQIGRTVMGYSLAMILFSQPLSRWSDRNQKMKAGVFWGGLLSGVVLLPFFFLSDAPVVALGIALLGTAHALSVPNQTKLASQLQSVRSVGVGNGLGIYRLAERAGNVVAPLLAGALVMAVGYARSLAVLGAYTVASSLLYLLVARRRAYLRVRIPEDEAVPCTVEGAPVRVLDLGPGGLSFEGSSLEPGARVELRLDLPGSGPLSLPAEVLSAGASGVRRCRFRRLSLDQSEAVQAWVFVKAGETGTNPGGGR
jgi:predicted MFS family arabinose efflux permease